ncbi:MAG: ribosomal protein S18-alanine N-acetyltransferase [Candidatus Cloacimonetes bacterium]|nr:ribosomal protein S18-alanine N-acetyltransferase [Candidatus Cloacimonadota bacterium]
MKIEEKVFTNMWNEEMFIEEIENRYAYVMMSKNQIMAYICGWMIYDQFDITNIAVLPEFQRKGYGSCLINFLISKLLNEKCYKFFLEVRESNLAAISFYKNLGFKYLGTRNSYYISPVEDAMIFAADFQNITH